MKKSRLRVFTKRFFIYLNVALVIFFLLSCLGPYLNPQKWWFISFLGLAFPFLLIAIVSFMTGWLIIRKPKLALISAIPLLISIKSISVFFAFHRPVDFVYLKDANTIRVASWNVARFIELKKNNNPGSRKRIKMLDELKEQNADVLCLQEFHTSIDTSYYDNIKAVKDLGYPYYYFSFDKDGDNHFYSSIIFSRFPIIDSGLVRYPRPSLPDALIHADLLVGRDTLRVYTTHLQSLQFKQSDYRALDEIKNVEDSILKNSRTIFSKLKRGISYRSIQADIISDVLDNNPHPVIFCADLNDVPNSYTYFTVRQGMQDAFLKKGFGIGRTFSGISPTLRIDYIFVDDHFQIKQFGRLVKELSDHYMLLADLELKK